MSAARDDRVRLVFSSSWSRVGFILVTGSKSSCFRGDLLVSWKYIYYTNRPVMNRRGYYLKLSEVDVSEDTGVVWTPVT